MLLSEIHDDASLNAYLINKILSKHTVYMWVYDSQSHHDNVKAEIDQIEDHEDGWVKIHYGIPNERSGDIERWVSEVYKEDTLHISQEGDEWWLDVR